jgi:hypothetical protein
MQKRRGETPNSGGKQVRMLDLFCGRLGWGRAFSARGWEVVGIDLVEPPEIPAGCTFIKEDILTITANFVRSFDFVCASSPCEQFSVHGMKHFHPNPPYPDLGMKLFNHTRSICEASGLPYVMENVRAAQKFVGNAVNHCGPFYLWGNAVPPLMPQGIIKGVKIGSASQMRKLPREEVRAWRKQYDILQTSSHGKERRALTAKWATIPPELANCVCQFAERLLEVPSCT